MNNEKNQTSSSRCRFNKSAMPQKEFHLRCLAGLGINLYFWYYPKFPQRKEVVCLSFCFCWKLVFFFNLHCQEYFYFSKNWYCNFSFWASQKITKPPISVNFIRMVLRFINTTIFVERKSTQPFQLSVMVHWVVEVHHSKYCFVFLIFFFFTNLFNKILVLEDSISFVSINFSRKCFRCGFFIKRQPLIFMFAIEYILDLQLILAITNI